MTPQPLSTGVSTGVSTARRPGVSADSHAGENGQPSGGASPVDIHGHAARPAGHAQAPPGAPDRLRRAALYGVVLGALVLSWSGQSATVAPLLGAGMAVAFAATVDLAAVLALHEAVSSPSAAVRGWAWSVLILAGGTSLSLNVYHAMHSGLLPGLVAIMVGAVPVLIAGLLSHVVAVSGGLARAVPEPPAAPAHEPRPEPAPEPHTGTSSEPPTGT